MDALQRTLTGLRPQKFTKSKPEGLPEQICVRLIVPLDSQSVAMTAQAKVGKVFPFDFPAESVPEDSDFKCDNNYFFGNLITRLTLRFGENPWGWKCLFSGWSRDENGLVVHGDLSSDPIPLKGVHLLREAASHGSVQKDGSIHLTVQMQAEKPDSHDGESLAERMVGRIGSRGQSHRDRGKDRENIGTMLNLTWRNVAF